MHNYSQPNLQTKRVVFPYNLEVKGNSSSSFYAKLNRFASEVENRGNTVFGKYLNLLVSPVLSTERNNMLLNILIAACMWDQYRGKWGRFIGIKHAILNPLYRIRKNNARLKPFVDKIRGRLAMFMLTAPISDLNIDKANLQKLALWLNSTGDLREESKAVKQLASNLSNIPVEFHEHFFSQVEAFAAWFKLAAKKELSDYTANVQAFISSNKQYYKGKENYFFCGRGEIEYHLNMVGAALMNKWLKPEFDKAKNKILLLPACMASGRNCRAVQLDSALLCTHCTPGCNISVTASQLNLSGVETLLIKHSSDFSKWLKPWANQKETALIGTACVLNLLQGGFEMKRLGIPSQCVFLDYSGCKKHWHPSGVPTKINIEQAELLVNKNIGSIGKPLSPDIFKSILLSFN